MSTNTLQNYELMVIFTPVLSEEDFKAAQKKFASIVTDNGGNIVHSNPWGLRTLAYPIDKKTTGIYYVISGSNPIEYNGAWLCSSSTTTSITLSISNNYVIFKVLLPETLL